MAKRAKRARTDEESMRLLPMHGEIVVLGSDGDTARFAEVFFVAVRLQSRALVLVWHAATPGFFRAEVLTGWQSVDGDAFRLEPEVQTAMEVGLVNLERRADDRVRATLIATQ